VTREPLSSRPHLATDALATRDFGDDLARLRAEVRDTLRHEIAHHLGWDEGGVRALGF
jgi:predicted Zn-dependent protease with MMP-like domain